MMGQSRSCTRKSEDVSTLDDTELDDVQTHLTRDSCSVNLNETAADTRTKSSKDSALHIAARDFNESEISDLLRRPATKTNDLDSMGNNVLHILCDVSVETNEKKCDQLKCVETVLNLCGPRQNPQYTREPLDINHCNKQGETPIFLAAKWNNKEIVRILLKEGCKIDVDYTWYTYDRKCARDLLIGLDFGEDDIPKKVSSELQVLLYEDKEKGFCERLMKNSVEIHGGRRTLLLIAVDRRLKEAVKSLLHIVGDAHKDIYDPPLFELAVRNNDHEMLTILMDKRPQLPENLLPVVEKCIDSAASQSVLSYDCIETFKKLLESKDIINSRNDHGYTPLHCAIYCGVSHFVTILLEKEILLGARKDRENTPLEIISSTDFRKFLDGRIDCESHQTPHKHITFDVSFLKYFDEKDLPRTQQYSCQTLLAMCKNKDLHCVITHPVVKCFLCHKWNALFLPFTITLLLHFILYVLLLCGVLTEKYRSTTNISASNESISENVKSNEHMNSLLVTVLHYLIMVVFIFLAITSAIYEYVTWMKPGSLKMYFVKIPLAACCVTLIVGVSDEHWRVTMLVFALLLSGANFVLLLGGIPTLSMYVTMMVTVSGNFLKFLLWFSPLLLAFVVSFVAVFRNETGSFPEFLGFWFVKHVTMITGEYERSDMWDKASVPILSHIVFIMFVFFIAIVLFNLLIAIAVSDTDTINDNAELLATMSRIKLLHRAEIFVTFLHDMCTCKREREDKSPENGGLISRFWNKLSLQDVVRSDGRMVAVPKYNRILKSVHGKEARYIDSKIMKSAENIWKTRSSNEKSLQ